MGGGVAGAPEPIILKAWSPGAKTIPIVVFSNRILRNCVPGALKACSGVLEHGNFAFRSPEPINICPGRSPRPLKGPRGIKKSKMPRFTKSCDFWHPSFFPIFLVPQL